MRHLDEGTIHAWLDGALSAEDERKAESHAARCTECASAVADARGFIAASSRILAALDNVPAGVIPADYRAMPGAAPAPRSAPRIPPWALRVAASLAVVATGTLVVLNYKSSGFRPPERDQSVAKDLPVAAPEASDAGGMDTNEHRLASPAPAAAGAAGAGAPVVADKLEESAKQKAVEPQRALGLRDSNAANSNAVALESKVDAATASKPAMQPPSAGMPANGAVAAAPAPAAAALAPGLATDQAQLTPKAPNAQSAQMGVASTAKRGAAPPFPGMRLVSEQTLPEETGVVQKKVYEVRPGVEVTLASFASTTAASTAAAPAESRSDADSAAKAARDSAGRAARRQFRMKSMDEKEGVNSIQWSDSTGTEFTLSGPLPLDSLRALRPLLATRPQRP
jgi:anti-sigma factor RsiW